MNLMHLIHSLVFLVVTALQIGPAESSDATRYVERIAAQRHQVHSATVEVSGTAKAEWYNVRDETENQGQASAKIDFTTIIDDSDQLLLTRFNERLSLDSQLRLADAVGPTHSHPGDPVVSATLGREWFVFDPYVHFRNLYIREADPTSVRDLHRVVNPLDPRDVE